MRTIINKVTTQNVTVTSNYWSSKLKIFQKKSLRHMIKNFEKRENGFIDNFVKSANGETDTFTGMWFFDGHIFETLRAIGHFLEMNKDRYLEKKADEWIEKIETAQLEDGYIHTYVTMLCPDKRWGQNGGDRALQHEIYNAGALVEAGVQYYKATGKIKLLDIAIRFANLIVDETGPAPKLEIVTDHPLSEEAFLVLYQFLMENPNVVQKLEVSPKIDRYLQIVKYWIDFRGRPRKGDNIGAYWSDAIPLEESKEISGHAVMAALLYLGVTKLYNVTKDNSYLKIAKRVWNNTINKKLYIHGGIGCGGRSGEEHENFGEGFGPDYVLPSDGYMESCSGVALGFWHHEMFLATGDGNYIDELERVIYNVALGAISQDGKKFYYSNKLNSEGFDRWDWHLCPCCPPMLMKFFGYLPELIYAADDNNLFVNLFISSKAEINIDESQVIIEQKSDYPWDGNTQLIINTDSKKSFSINLRIPGWLSGRYQKKGLYHYNSELINSLMISLNGVPLKYKIRNGYLKINRVWTKGDKITYSFPLEILRINPNSKILDVQNQNAFMIGPMLYCYESTDNKLDVNDLFIPKKTEHNKVPIIINNEKVIGIQCELQKKSNLKKEKSILIPYYLRCNRGSSNAHVWIDNQYFFDIKGYTKKTNNYHSIKNDSHRVCFIRSKKLEIFYHPQYSKIFYDQNNKSLDSKSKYYNGPINIYETTRVLFNCLNNDNLTNKGKSVLCEKLDYHNSLANLKTLKPGLKCRTYFGSWDEYRILEMRKIYRSTISENIILPKLKKDQRLLISYTGLVHIKKSQLYTFQLKSSIAFKIYVAGQKIIDKEETQGMINNSGEIALKKGYHYLRVLVMIAERFQRVGQDGFSLTYGIDKSNYAFLKNSLLYHT